MKLDLFAASSLFWVPSHCRGTPGDPWGSRQIPIGEFSQVPWKVSKSCRFARPWKPPGPATTRVTWWDLRHLRWGGLPGCEMNCGWASEILHQLKTVVNIPLFIDLLGNFHYKIWGDTYPISEFVNTHFVLLGLGCSPPILYSFFWGSEQHVLVKFTCWVTATYSVIGSHSLETV